ncbi:hypothetical protein [Gemmatimonas groenlandica]|uniref:Uncharacterized protein n=1 Tax=Gemmatimonas groenlandica TaxID=2732249 RepID=A0A6M4INF4_9BACT|nr:hypothetical protein [Gemmatimonas groenlandica]QJR35007.1 hypothetical protein HKW67_05510 [Gemmatimonas groenlandica]
MKRLFRTLMPLLPIGLAILAGIDAVTAFQTERTGRGAFKVLSVLVWLFIAYMLYETNKRIPTDEK